MVPKRALLFLMRCHLMISSRSCKGLMRKIRLHNKNKLARMLAQLSAEHFHLTLAKIIKQWHWPVLVLCFQHIQMLSKLNYIKKVFSMIHFRQSLACCNSSFIEILIENKDYSFIYSCFTIQKHFFMQMLPWAVTFAHPTWRTINYEEFCSCLFVYISLLYLSIRQKSLIRHHHHHQVPFFRRIIVLFMEKSSIFKKMQNLT